MMRSRRLYETHSRILRALEGLAAELCAAVYIFGSHARGDYTLESDVDVVVVSEVFRGVRMQERVVMVRLRLPSDVGFDIIPLTPDELREKLSKPFFREISKHWVKVKGGPDSKCSRAEPP